MTTLFPNTPEIMEVTLRDGSYVIDFQFTAEDTANMVAALAAVGFRWIEVGHGLGLNAQDKGLRRAAATDEAHLEAAAGAAGTARWGTFFIPGIGRAEDIDLAARYGMSFIRVGTNITDYERARPFIEQARERGIITCYNAMKSYAVTPQEYAQVAGQVAKWGAQIVYIVDSAGTMMPEDVAAFVQAVRDVTDVPVGFHGHDNLSLGMANTLQAIESGAAIVDSSLRGMGRSAGNVITEALLALLQRRGHLHEIDLKGTMDISAGLIAPLVPGRGLDTMAVTAGYAGFHSAFTEKVKHYADQYSVDMRDLIIKLCEENRIDAPDDLLQRASIELAQAAGKRAIDIPGFSPRQGDETTISLDELLKRLYAEATKAGTFTALNVVMGRQLEERCHISAHIHNTPLHTIGSVTVSAEAQLVEVLREADGAVDLILMDTDRRRIFGPQLPAETAADLVKKSALLPYSDGRVWVEAIKDQLLYLLGGLVQGSHVLIAGDHERSRALALTLLDHGAQVTIAAPDIRATDHAEALQLLTLDPHVPVQILEAAEAGEALANAQAVVVWPQQEAWFGPEQAAHLHAGTYVIDAGIGALPSVTLEQVRAMGALPIRVNIWPTLAGALLAAHESRKVRTEALGWDQIDGVSVVAGGAIGAAGALILDSVRHPTRIIGVADGQGGMSPPGPEHADAVRRVRAAINRRRVEPQL